MQIVIDIPEEVYNLLKDDGVDWLAITAVQAEDVVRMKPVIQADKDGEE